VLADDVEASSVVSSRAAPAPGIPQGLGAQRDGQHVGGPPPSEVQGFRDFRFQPRHVLIADVPAISRRWAVMPSAPASIAATRREPDPASARPGVAQGATWSTLTPRRSGGDWHGGNLGQIS